MIFSPFAIFKNDMPRAVYTFFEDTDFSGKNVYLYTSTLGSGFARTISGIQKLIPEAGLCTQGLHVASSRIANAAKEIDAWLKKVGLIK
ncbi:flavodoxin [Treponema parvum]